MRPKNGMQQCCARALPIAKIENRLIAIRFHVKLLFSILHRCHRNLKINRVDRIKSEFCLWAVFLCECVPVESYTQNKWQIIQ